MFTNLTIISEIARQRQSVLTTRSDRNRAVRRWARSVPENSAPADSLVA